MHRYFVTGTDTDVGKTRVAGALALALRRAMNRPTVVKPVQTGLPPGLPGDAARAGALAGVPSVEFFRFKRAADPWSAAVAEGVATLRAGDLVDMLNRIQGPIVAEGVGGIMVPLNHAEHLAHVAASAKLSMIITVGLRLGCISHALLTIDACRRLEINVMGAVLVERWGPRPVEYRREVMSVLSERVAIIGVLPFELDETSSVLHGARVFDATARQFQALGAVTS